MILCIFELRPDKTSFFQSTADYPEKRESCDQITLYTACQSVIIVAVQHFYMGMDPGASAFDGSASLEKVAKDSNVRVAVALSTSKQEKREVGGDSLFAFAATALKG